MPFHFPKGVNKVGKMLTMRFKGAQKEDEPRLPPPAATPLSFPRPDLGNGSPQIPPQLSYEELYKILVVCPRSGPTLQHLKSFNLQLAHDVSLEALIPANFLPPPAWLDAPTDTTEQDTFPAPSSSPPKSLLSNGVKIPNQSDFHVRVAELLHSTDDAFSVIQRKKLPNGKDVRLGHFRKFFDKLFAMAEYWDTSIDAFIPAHPYDDDQTEKYTGRRISCGSKMPTSYREEMVHEFVMTITLCFGCRAATPNMAPKLHFNNMRILVPQYEAIYRSPANKAKAKARILEGPIASVSVRSATRFRDDYETLGTSKIECLDLAREVACALSLAQKRNLEGAVKTVPGQGKFWAETPRWGGAEGPADDPKASAGDKKNQKLWKRMLPPSSDFEKNVEYVRIGQQKGQDYEDIYLISAINHHLSIMRVRVPDKYMDMITNGRPTGSRQGVDAFIPAKESWFKLEVGRSVWYDLLVAGDRAEAMRGVWGMMAFMMRAE